MVRNMYQGYTSNNENAHRKKEKPIMHGCRISHWDNLNDNDMFEDWKLIIQGYNKMCGSDLNENENYKKEMNNAIF